MNPVYRPVRIMIMVVAVATAGLVAACQSDDDNQTGNANVSGDTVATVDRQTVTDADLDAQIQAMASRGQAVEPDEALQELIDLVLLAHAAEKQQLHEQPEIAAEIRRQRAMLLANHLMRAELQDLDIEEDALRARYEEALNDSTGRREYHAHHILTEEREEAEEIIAQLDEGADFAELAREYSIGPSADRGGNLDWFRASDVVEPFAAGLQTLDVGAYSAEPVETRFGWHVILLADVREAEPAAFDEVREDLRNRMIAEHLERYLETLRADADIDIR